MVLTNHITRKIALILAAVALTACGDGNSGGGSRSEAEEAASVADLFPDTGVRGYVLNTCGSCHSVACTVIDQRSDEEWGAIEMSHADYIPGLSVYDRRLIFDYLRHNFGPDQPEPDVPPEYLRGGCPSLQG